MANIQVFEYQNNKVRTVDVEGEAWFVLKDVCEILRMDTTQLKKVADRLDEDEKGRTLITTPRWNAGNMDCQRKRFVSRHPTQRQARSGTVPQMGHKRCAS